MPALPFSLGRRVSLRGLALAGLLNSWPAWAMVDAARFHEDATRLYSGTDYRAAIIQLKNALQQDPRHMPSLLLAGQTYLKLGDPVAARGVLEQALLQGADPGFTHRLLAQAYLQLGEYQTLLDRVAVDSLPSALDTDLLGYRAEAYLGLNDTYQAAKTIAAADALDPRALLPNLARVTLLLRQGKADQALQIGEMLIRDHATDARAWNSHASALHAQGALRPALASYDRAIALDPDHVNARVARIGLLVDLRRDADAQGDLDYLEQKHPYEPRAAYLRALIHGRAGERDAEAAELSKCAAIVEQLPPGMVAANPQLTLVAALSHFSLKQYPQARAYLEPFLIKSPDHLGGRRLYGAVLLEMSDAKAALKVLKPILDDYPDDVQALNLLAAAHGRAGQSEQAVAMLERLRKLGVDGEDIRARLALGWLNAGQLDRGIDALGAIFEADPTRLDIGLSLALASLDAGRFQAALRVAQSLIEQRPNDPSYRNVLGIAQYGSGQLEAARATFAAILSGQPDFLPARVNLAKTEIAAGDYQAAEQRLTALAAEVPDNPEVLLEQARLARATDRLDEALRQAEKALQAAPDRLEIQRFLIELYLRMGKHDQAEMLARKAAASTTDEVEALAILAEVQARAGRSDHALSTYSRMETKAGYDVETLYRIARLQVGLGGEDDARLTLHKALVANPLHLPSRLAYVELHLKLGELDNALSLAQALVVDFPSQASAHVLEGRALFRLRRFGEAEASFAKACDLEYQPQCVIARVQALLAQDSPGPAEALLREAWRDHPRDAALGAAHAELLIAQHRWAEAETTLREALAQRPDQPQLLNNLAYALSRQERLDEALEVARRAKAAAPEDALIDDTLGWILVQRRETEEGLMYLRQAVARLATHPELRYHLAVAQYELGRANEARAELERALADEAPFEGREEAERLRERLR